MKKEYKFVNLGNDFYEKNFEECCSELEAGNTIMLGADCIGHTRAEMVERLYVNNLRKKYPNIKIVRPNDAWKDCIALS